MHRKILLGLILCLLVYSCAIAQGADAVKVFEKNGNIYYLKNGKTNIQLTMSGQDRAPLLSPGGKTVAFIRKSKEKAYLVVGAEEDYTPEGLLADQLWIVDLDTKQEKLVAKDKSPIPGAMKGDGVTEQLRRMIQHIDNGLQFSPHGKKIYFITSAWVTSGAVHCINIDGTEEHFVTDGNTLLVVDRGRYKGNLIVNKHKYFLLGGSYDWYWMVTPEGKEVGPVIDDDLNRIDWEFLYWEDEN